MYKRSGRNTRSSRRKKRNKKRFYAILFIIILLITSSRTFKLLNNSKSEVLAVSSDEVLSKMILNNPIKSGLNQEIKKIEDEKAKKKLEYMREVEKEKQEKIRLEEEAKLLKEKELNKNKKIAYLTFDDGPSRNITPRILDILKDYDVKATFFVLGKVAETNPDMLKRIHSEGHSIGHHSYSHDYGYIYKSPNNFIAELDKTNRVFKSILGKDFETKLLRFPGGSFEKRKQKTVQETAALGYRNYDWNALNGDAEGHNLSKATLVNRLKSTVPSGSSGEKIILMHDTDAKKTTADALPEIIEYLLNEGYELKALNEK